ncbi:MAG: endonuclease III [Defluviitaleaceae bacterium]|nr:endonuclease III [Defluviitaleaceae bacterium]
MVSKIRAREMVNMMCQLYPDAHCELIHANAFELTIAVLLSAQTTDKGVNKVTPNLFAKYQTPADYLAVPLSDIENDLRAIGLYKTKAKNVRQLCELLISNYGGEIPGNYDDLITLPGVGRKTANVVLSVWFGVPRIAVDTHVERISKRLKFARLKDTVLEVEHRLMYLLPEEMWSHAHHAMIFFGRYHCTAKRPKCTGCPLNAMCGYKDKEKIQQ